MTEPTTRAGAAASPDPTVSGPGDAPAPTSTPVAAPVVAPVLVVSEFGFQITLSPGIADATYSVETGYAGTYTNSDGAITTTVAAVDLSTPEISGNAAICGNYAQGAPFVAGQIIVYSNEPTNGAANVVQVGSYWLSYQPWGIPAPPGCSAGTADLPLFLTAEASAVPTDPTAIQAPVVTTPAPVLISVAAWANNRDCPVADAFLQEDAIRDHQTSVGLADGSLTTYPVADAAVYAMWSQRWYTLLGEAEVICSDQGAVGATSVAPHDAQITQADAWMSEAIGNHTYDAQHVPGDSAWDAQWTAIYTALIAQWNALVVA